MQPERSSLVTDNHAVGTCAERIAAVSRAAEAVRRIVLLMTSDRKQESRFGVTNIVESRGHHREGSR